MSRPCLRPATFSIPAPPRLPPSPPYPFEEHSVLGSRLQHSRDQDQLQKAIFLNSSLPSAQMDGGVTVQRVLPNVPRANDVLPPFPWELLFTSWGLTSLLPGA